MIIIQSIFDLLVIGDVPTSVNNNNHIVETFEIEETVEHNIKIFEVSEILYLIDSTKLALFVLEIIDELILYEIVSRPVDLYIADHFDLDELGRTVLYELVEEVLVLIEEVIDSSGFTEIIELEDSVTFSMTRNLEVAEELNYSEGALGYILDSGYSTCEE